MSGLEPNDNRGDGARSGPTRFDHLHSLDVRHHRLAAECRVFGREDAEGLSDTIGAFMQANIPLQRLATSDDLAGTALYLASDDSSFVTGIALPVDGGYLAR
jgi:NAD(P)-dependent dehydrogenase (short-subunit alcohol dehydrogenase family)